MLFALIFNKVVSFKQDEIYQEHFDDVVRFVFHLFCSIHLVTSFCKSVGMTRLFYFLVRLLI